VKSVLTSLGCFVLAFVLTSDTPHLRAPAIALALGITAMQVAVRLRIRALTIVNTALVATFVWALWIASLGERLVALLAFVVLAGTLALVRARVKGRAS
jgi:hypothetical protein